MANELLRTNPRKENNTAPNKIRNQTSGLINDNWSCRLVALPKNITGTLAPMSHSDQRQFRQPIRFR